MNKFSQAYAAARTALGSDGFTDEVEKMRPKLQALMTDGGPSAAHSEQLGKLRMALKTAQYRVAAGKSLQPAIAAAQAILECAGNKAGKPERVATVKMLKHLYHSKSAGGQAVWVYSPPKAYTQWIFDETAGGDDTKLKGVLGKPEDEVYSETQRGIMSDALQAARKVCLDAVVKLGEPNAATKNVIRRYFGNSASTDLQLKTTASTLRSGYQKIANACNSSVVIISDEPGDRCGDGWEDWAFIYTTEAMSVIYLQNAWLKKSAEATPSNQSPLFRCARTIVHEMSHKQLSTEDVVYGPRGLMPQGSGALTPEYALHNADSWAYFSMDVTGNLTGPDAANGTTACTAIREVPVRVLTTA